VVAEVFRHVVAVGVTVVIFGLCAVLSITLLAGPGGLSLSSPVSFPIWSFSAIPVSVAGAGIGVGAPVSNSKVSIGSVVICSTLDRVESSSCVGAVVVGDGAGDGAVAAVSDPIGFEFGVDVSAGEDRAGVGTGAGVGVGVCTDVFGSRSAGVMTVTGRTFDWVSTDNCTAVL
jgi:hypothetical protein